MKVNKVVRTSSFKRGVKALAKDHKQKELNKLEEIIRKLCNFEITSGYKNHPLVGAEDAKELHISGDILLVYRYVDGNLIISLELLDLLNHKELKRKY